MKIKKLLHKYLLPIFICLFDLTKIDCSIYLIVKSLCNITEMCKIIYVMCSLIFYFCLKRSQFFVTETGSQIKYLVLHISIIFDCNIKFNFFYQN